MASIKALVITGFGLNCERETAAAFSLAGAEPALVHLNDLLAGRESLDSFHILAFIGGFSFGDHLGSGSVFANKVRHGLGRAMRRFIADGKLVIGICNGFQTMTRLGLVPALGGAFFTQTAALAHNDSGLFRDAWVTLRADPGSPCVFTKGIDLIELPIRHGEGKFVAPPDVLDAIDRGRQAPLRYAAPDGSPARGFPDNPNGSLRGIAGVCDPSGRVFGLMPHPEAFLSPLNHPIWPRLKAEGRLPAEGAGVRIFRNAVAAAAEL